MDFKAKAVGLFVGFVLTLGPAASVVAETVDSEVTLTETACAPGITQANVDFGTYVFDPEMNGGLGGFRATTANDGKASFTVMDASAGRRADCRTQVEASVLLDSFGGNAISVLLKENPDGTSGNPITVTLAPGTSTTVDALLPDNLPGTSRVDTYTGTGTVSNAAGS
ncbi:MAG: hypothetical protein M3457_18140 [Chloroflexota bacterium]|nr:hypothetical protein [Chloroflexota bacterium]